MISAAADLMYVRGVNAVTLDDVRAATGTSKSQLYKHFPDGKPELVRAVVALRAEQILAREEQRLERLKSMSGLRRWRDALVQGAALQGGAYGCALGNLVVELSDQDDQARTSLSGHFAAWEGLLAAGFRRMQDDGILSAKADPDALATGLMAALQGGYLLAQANHDVAPMATALDMALAHIESLTSAHENRQATQDGHFLTPCGRHPAAPQDRRQTLSRRRHTAITPSSGRARRSSMRRMRPATGSGARQGVRSSRVDRDTLTRPVRSKVLCRLESCCFPTRKQSIVSMMWWRRPPVRTTSASARSG